MLSDALALVSGSRAASAPPAGARHPRLHQLGAPPSPHGRHHVVRGAEAAQDRRRLASHTRAPHPAARSPAVWGAGNPAQTSPAGCTVLSSMARHCIATKPVAKPTTFSRLRAARPSNQPRWLAEARINHNCWPRRSLGLKLTLDVCWHGWRLSGLIGALVCSSHLWQEAADSGHVQGRHGEALHLLGTQQHTLIRGIGAWAVQGHIGHGQSFAFVRLARAWFGWRGGLDQAAAPRHTVAAPSPPPRSSGITWPTRSASRRRVPAWAGRTTSVVRRSVLPQQMCSAPRGEPAAK